MTMRGRWNRILNAGRARVQSMRDRAERVRTLQAMSPHQRWELSTSKASVDCVLDLDDGTRPRLIGAFAMDIDAPCDVMREYIERSFREPLNELVGEDFLFFMPGPGGGDLLPRKLEARSWAKDYAELKEVGVHEAAGEDDFMDEEAKDKPRRVTIMRDRTIPAGPPSMIPAFRDQEPLSMIYN